MAQSFLEAAMLAVNLAHGVHIEAAALLPPDFREREIATENRIYLDQMAALGCSSASACTDSAGPGRCASIAAADVAKTPPDGVAIDYGGARWNVQNNYHGWPGETGSIEIQPDGMVSVAARAGNRAWFDPPRKIRAELCGRERFPEDAEIHMKFKVRLDAASVISGLDWIIIAQVHQADMRYADGAYVEASPPFAIAIVQGPKGEELAVSGETAAVPMREPEIDPKTGLQSNGPDGPRWIKRFAPQRRIGKSAPFSRGDWHEIEFRFRDGHGRTGAVFVSLDDAVLADEKAIPTGYSYVDDLRDVPFAGGPQLTGSYVKFGLYAGKFEGDPPPNVFFRLHFKDVGSGS
jgi:hypothetical protein